MPLALGLITALVAGALGSAAPAPAAEPERVELAGTELLMLVADASGVRVAAAHEGQKLDPAATVFTADAEQEAVSSIGIDASALPAGTVVSDVQLRYAVASAPDGGAVSMQTVDADGIRVEWAADTPRPASVEAPTGLALAFDRAGTYTVEVTAAVTVTADSVPAPVPAEATPSTEPTATTTAPLPTTTAVTANAIYTFDVSTPASPVGTVSPGSEASGLEQEDADASTGAESDAAAQPDMPQSDAGRSSAAQAPAAAQAPTGSAQTVVSTGDLRVTTSLEGGALVQRLEDFSDDPSGTPLDLASTVLAVPTAEAWPGGNDGEDADVWGRIVPDRGQVWRTAAGGVGANALVLSIDSSAVPKGAVHGNQAMFGEGGIHSRLGSISGPGAGALLTDGFYEWGASFRTETSPWTETGPTGDFGFIPSRMPFAAVFTAPGRYCVTVETFAQLADAGTVLNNDVTLTFAVGTDDAGPVQPCTQPAPIPAQAPVPVPGGAAGTTVIDSGVALLGSTLSRGALSLDVVTTDRGRTTAYDPAMVVFSLPNRDSQWPGTPYWGDMQENWARMVPEGTRPWRTTGQYPSAFTALDSLDRQSNPLALDLEARFVDSAALAPDSADVTYEFIGASTTSATGYFTTYRSDTYEGAPSYADNVAFWDSRTGGDRTDQHLAVASAGGEPFYTPHKDKSANLPALGTVFSEAGVYCVTVRTSTVLADGTPVDDEATFTFAVGVDASAVAPCSQESGQPGDGGGGEQPGDLDPTVTWMQQGHVDLALREGGDGELEFETGDPGTVGMIPLADAVWVGRGTYATFTVREPTSLDDRTFIGDVGSTYYGFTQAGTSASRTLWPGLSMLYLPKDLTDRPATWTLSKASGPGDVFAWTNDGNVYLDSKTQTSTSFPVGHTHVHENWAFTQPGVYCLAVSARLRADDDEMNDRAAVSLLTVVVGDVDLSTVQPCERDQEPPAPPAPTAIVSTDDRVVIGTGEVARGLELRSVNGVPDVVASVIDRIGASRRHVNAEKVVFQTREFAGRYQLNALRWETFLHEAGGSDISVALGDVTGPGDYFVTGNRADYSDPQFDTREGQERTHETLWPGYVFSSSHNLTAQGVYCVPFTWAGQTAHGTDFTVTKTLTFAAGVDPATVTPCADGGEGTDPGGGGGGEVEWDVPNRSSTNSGATILNVGHVDIASRFDDGTFKTVIKDDTDGTVYRDPASTVLQILPGAELDVPDIEAFRFLGAPGAPIWMVDEVQQEGLLWPGWSTEMIDYGVIPDGADWRLDRIEGPGEFSLFQSGVFGEPQVLLNTRDGTTDADRFTIPEHVHAHGTWAFSAEGVYCLGFSRSATRANGSPVSDDFTLVYAVGEVDIKAVDPAACFTDPTGRPDTIDTTPVAAAELTEANAGAVQVLGGAEGFNAGQLITAQIGEEHAGEWLSVWLHSAPQWLGWAQVGSSGAIQVRLPVDAAIGAHRLVVKNPRGDLLGWDSLSIVKASVEPAPPGTPPGGGAPAPVQVAATQCVAGATILSSGHVDFASRIVGGRLESLVGDGTSGSKVYREPAGTILWLKPTSQVRLPGGYGQVGPVGSNVWQVPQTQNPDLIWLGWSTEALNAGNTRGPVTWSIDSISGPGSVKAYLTGSFGGVQSMVFDNGGSYSIPLGVHAHANWAFSAEGIYRITMTQTATLTNGQVSSDTETLTIVVGDVDPASAAGSGTGCGTISNALLLSDDADGARLAADQAAADAADAARTVLPGQAAEADAAPADPFTALSQGDPVPLLLSVLGALLLIGAAGTGALWWRRRQPGSTP